MYPNLIDLTQECLKVDETTPELLDRAKCSAAACLVISKALSELRYSTSACLSTSLKLLEDDFASMHAVYSLLSNTLKPTTQH